MRSDSVKIENITLGVKQENELTLQFSLLSTFYGIQID